MSSLPIDSILPKLKEAVLKHPAVVLQAPPGAGKTTRVPLALLDVIAPEAGRIVMLEPRRIAATAAARWMAQTLGEEAGGTVGYAIRYDAKRSRRTRIEVVTEGILTRRLQSDPALEGTALVIFDEFHERSIHADLSLALCLDVQQGLRPDLKILVMSATLDADPVASLLGGAPVISSEGRSYPVEERYVEERPEPLPLRTASAARTALRETNGDILVFLPGAGEIRACARELQETLDLTEERLSLHPLYGDLPFEDQERAIVPSKDRRKIVLATNIAETSLTIQGVHVVIDSGLTRMLRYDPATGMNRLVTATVSRASAEQRKGRAGRLGPGVCYRLYGRETLRSLVPFSPPEILVSDLAPLALELAVWGVKDPRRLAWLDAPPASAWEPAVSLLRDLGALDRDGSATEAGRLMVRIPLHPRLARLMLRAQTLACVGLGADLAALVTERDIFRRGPAETRAPEPDISERLDALHRWRRTKEAGGIADPGALRTADRTASQLLRLMQGREGAMNNDAADAAMTGRLLLAAFPDRICKQRDEGGQSYVHAQGRAVRLSPGSHLRNSAYVLAVHADAGEKAEGFIHLAAPLTESLIREECADRIRPLRRVAWSKKEGRVIAAVEERLDALTLSSRQFAPTDEESVPLLCEALRADPGILQAGSEFRQYQARASLVRKTFPEEAWPDLSDTALFSRPEAWLADWLGGARSLGDLKRLNALPALKAILSRDQQRVLERRAPTAITVPSGSRIVLEYASGEGPVLAVKLQELFGLADTPVIADGRVPVLLHLLSPARRPVQITRDLRNFWNAVYPAVKRDLQGRYPRHPWPDDPWNAVPTRRTKPRGQ
jgi:ATP-dependent helicase HrpB